MWNVGVPEVIFMCAVFQGITYCCEVQYSLQVSSSTLMDILIMWLSRWLQYMEKKPTVLKVQFGGGTDMCLFSNNCKAHRFVMGTEVLKLRTTVVFLLRTKADVTVLTIYCKLSIFIYLFFTMTSQVGHYIKFNVHEVLKQYS